MPNNDPVKTDPPPDQPTHDPATDPSTDPSAVTGSDGEKTEGPEFVEDDGSAAWKTKPWRAPFIQALSLMGDVSAACRAVRIARATAYRDRGMDEGFALAWADAVETFADSLEQGLWEWAKRGVPVEKTVTKTFPGKDGSVVTETTVTRSTQRSVTAAIFLLKGLRPRKYHEFAAPPSAPAAAPVVVRERTPARLEELLEIAGEVGWSPSPDTA